MERIPNQKNSRKVLTAGEEVKEKMHAVKEDTKRVRMNDWKEKAKDKRTWQIIGYLRHRYSWSVWDLKDLWLEGT